MKSKSSCTLPAAFRRRFTSIHPFRSALAVALAALCWHNVNAALFLEETFPYATGNLAGQGAWSGGSGSQVAAGSLAYPGLASPTVTSNKANLPSTASTALKSFNGSAITSGSVYISFLLRQTTLTASTTGGTVAGLDDDGSVTTSSGRVAAALGVHLKQTNTTRFLLGIRKGNGASGAGDGTDVFYTGASFTTNETVFVVARYQFNAGAGDDTVTLWVNPPAASFGSTEPTPSIAATTTGNGADVTGLQYIFVRCNSSTATGVNEIDDFRVGSTWADVTPSDGPVAPPPQPYITQTLLSANALILRGTNGTPNGVYRVVASTDLLQARSQWPILQTNRFDAGGQFDCTNPISPGEADRYYAILTGGELPPGPIGPTITNPPASLTVTNGQPASFNVVAGGTPPLFYQWFFNATTPLPDATNASLLIASTTTNDAGFYSVRVSNSVDSVMSSAATLTVLVPPSISTPPTNLTVLAGQNATFTVLAAGTAPLRYQWYFNTNTVLASATNASLTLSNCQFADQGGYSVRVTNAAGAVTSTVVSLTVHAPPTITTDPLNQTVLVSNNVTFSVAATGTAPLSYQWYFNTNTLLTNATSASLTLTNVQTNQAGGYSVIVTNAYGSATSLVAALTVNLSNAVPNFALVGFAAMNGFASNGTLLVGGTIGGDNGPIVLATNLATLVNYVERSNIALRVLVTTDIDCSSLSNNSGGFPANYPTGEILVNSNKTIFSTNGATISRGTFRIGKGPNGKSNIIIRNLKFRDLWVFDPSGNYDTYGWDYVGIEAGSHHIWVDHCDFDRVYDGMVDAKGGSDYITVSWNVFRNQKKCNLIGHSDSGAAAAVDRGHLNVTFHHNYYVDVEERMPRMRFGNAHVFNLYCVNLGGRGVQSTTEAATLVENSYWEYPQANSLPTAYENGGPTGIVKVASSVIVNLPGNNVQFREFGQTNFLFNAPFVGPNPPYVYANVLDPVADVPNIVTNWAGVGKITF